MGKKLKCLKKEILNIRDRSSFVLKVNEQRPMSEIAIESRRTIELMNHLLEYIDNINKIE